MKKNILDQNAQAYKNSTKRTRITSTAELQEYKDKVEGASVQVQPMQYTPPSVWKELGGLGMKIIVIAVVFTIIFTFFYGFHRVINPDMSPMIRTGDLVLFYRLNREYAIGDLLVLDFQGERHVRRVVARAGDTVEFSNGNLVVNGSIQQETDIFFETWQYDNDLSFPLVVGNDQVFVLGDAREGVSDSRVFGAVNVEDTHGKVITIIRRRNF